MYIVKQGEVMNSTEAIINAGFLPSSSISLRYETNETDNVKNHYQLWDVEFVHSDKSKNNIYILFRLNKNLFKNHLLPWKWIQIVTINQQPKNENKKRPAVENYSYDINLDIKFDEFNNLFKNYLISKNFSEENKDKDIKTALFDIETWLMKTRDERANIQLENFKIDNPNIHTFEIDESIHDNLDILQFKLLIFHFLNIAKKRIPQKDIQNTNFEKIIKEFSDLNLALNFLETSEVSIKSIFLPVQKRKQENDLSIFLPLYICLTSDVEDQQRLEYALKKIGINRETWQKTFTSFLDEQNLKNIYMDNGQYNLNFQKNKYVFEFLSKLLEVLKNENIIDSKTSRKFDLTYIQVIFSFISTNNFLTRSSLENKITYQLTRKGKSFLNNQLNNS